MMRMLNNVERDLLGFDLTPAMVDEAKTVGRKTGIPEENFWVGDATDPNAYTFGPGISGEGYDALICSGFSLISMTKKPPHCSSICAML